MLKRTSKKQNTPLSSKKAKAPAKMKASSSANGSVRIISGMWRGRKLPVKDLEGLRPTTDRVKETLFNWLAPYLYQAKCLDVFAGSGSLGLEALSRQAQFVTFLELNTDAAAQIKTNLTTLKADNAKVEKTDALSFLTTASQSYDIIFIDPPFRHDLTNKIISLLDANHWLAENALIYIETEKEFGLPKTPANWHLLKEKQAGQVSFRLYQLRQDIKQG